MSHLGVADTIPVVPRPASPIQMVATRLDDLPREVCRLPAVHQPPCPLSVQHTATDMLKPAAERAFNVLTASLGRTDALLLWLWCYIAVVGWSGRPYRRYTTVTVSTVTIQ